jgi:hypothetical protein
MQQVARMSPRVAPSARPRVNSAARGYLWRELGPDFAALNPGCARYFGVLAVTSTSISIPGQASAVMTRNVPAGGVAPA